MKSVFVTGGTRGIGKAAAELFAQNGYRVGFCYKENDAAAKELAENLGAAIYRSDVSDKAAMEAAAQDFGSIDVLICSAAISGHGLFQDITESEWCRTFDINFFGAVNAINAFLPKMLHKKSGSIITVASVWGEVGASCESHYSASKGALIALTKSLAKELALSDITVNCVSPGVIDTDMNSHLSDAEKAALSGEIPLSRFGTAKEVAEAIYFLAQSGYITGQVLGVNGGYNI